MNQTQTVTRLDDILELGEPMRTNALKQWIYEGDHDYVHDGRVLIKTADGSTITFPFNGKPFVVPPQGRRVSRRVAVELLRMLGKNGYLRNRDIQSGFTRGQWARLKKEDKEYYKARGIEKLEFITTYLTHVPDEDAAPIPLSDAAGSDAIEGEDAE